MILDTLREKAHWYSPEGAPMHDADLRQARKLGLFPSVTSVLSVWPKPALDNYKIESGILAALTLPRLAGETDDQFAHRVVDDSHAHRSAAATFGKSLHDVCQRLACGQVKIGDLTDDVPCLEHARLFWDWFQDTVTHVYSAETVAVSKRYGYAGTYDLAADTKEWGRVLFDWKTQGVKDKGPRFWDTWAFQLSAYEGAIHETAPGLIETRISVIIDSGKPSPPAVQVWTEDAMPQFLSCLNLWRLSKKYPYSSRTE